MVLTSNCPAELCTVYIFERKSSLDVVSGLTLREREFLAYSFIVLPLSSHSSSLSNPVIFPIEIPVPLHSHQPLSGRQVLVTSLSACRQSTLMALPGAAPAPAQSSLQFVCECDSLDLPQGAVPML